MALSAEDVVRVAKLAQLTIEPDQVADLANKLSGIVGLVALLSEVDTDNVEPMVHAFELTNVLAKDVIELSLDRKAALQNAPSSDEECFRVPAVLG
jgi:aspartyl-tRNA(Asn)/glutamyl-tRNA(Gln) amidotransferase subunit C